MDNVLETLIKVQRHSDDIDAKKTKIDKIPQQISVLEDEIEKIKSNLQEKKNRIQEIKKNYKLKEVDFAENENKINKLNSQTFEVKTNEEYRSIINEISYLKKENEKIEDEMISLLEEEEILKNTIDKIESETNEFISKKMSEIDKLKKDNEELIAQLKQCETDFATYFNKLPSDIKTLYEKIRQVRGKVVCLVENETCTGCYANFTPQFMNELKKRNRILLCDSCGRILIYATADINT